VKTWSDNPFPVKVPVSVVGIKATIIAEHRGESSVIYEIGGHKGWLAKRYKMPLSSARQDDLIRLIELPGNISDNDRAIVDEAVAWPVSRIVEESRTVGVIIAKAPKQFFYDVIVSHGRTRQIAVTIDHLSMTAEQYQRLGLPAPDMSGRLAIVRRLVSVGELLERHGLVYGDWSYSNAFWSPRSHRAFVIDADSCGFRHRPWVESNTWDDPLVPHGSTLTTFTDRYKLTLLATRCLTGARSSDPAALKALPSSLLGSRIEQLLWQGLTASTLTGRPSLSDLLAALDQSAMTSANVTGWVPVGLDAPTRHAAPPGRPPLSGSRTPPNGHGLDPAANVTSWRPVGHQPTTTPANAPRRWSTARKAVVIVCLLGFLLVLGIVIHAYT
jgi:hypothetical protein